MQADEIRTWREARGLTQAQLAEVLSADGKLAQATVSRWETGEHIAPAYLRLALEELDELKRRAP